MKDLITINNDTALLNEETSLLIAEFERQVKEIKIQEEELKAEILKEMEERGITKLETPELSISYIYPYDREVLTQKSSGMNTRANMMSIVNSLQLNHL